MTPTPETPAGGLTTAEREALTDMLVEAFSNSEDYPREVWVDDVDEWVGPTVERLIAARVAAAVVQARAEDRTHIEAAWDEGYAQGVNDERTSQDWTDGQIGPARANPYRSQAHEECLRRIEAMRRICANVITAHAAVQMDNPEDKALHAEVVETFRAALTATEDGHRP